MSDIDTLKAALAKLPPRPWNVTIVPPSTFQQRGYTADPTDSDGVGPQSGFEVGTVRAVNGANVVEPWPESASMIIAIPGVLQALVDVINKADEIAKSA